MSASAHKDPQMARTGSRVRHNFSLAHPHLLTVSWRLQIFLVGLILQLISFVCFMAVYFRFTWRMWKLEPEICKRDVHLPWYNDWRALCAAMWISCIGVLVSPIRSTLQLGILTSFRYDVSSVQSNFRRGSKATSRRLKATSTPSTSFPSLLPSSSTFPSGPGALFPTILL